MRRIIFSAALLFALSFCTKEPVTIPEEFSGLKLVEHLTGAEAINFVNRLHFNSVTSEKNEIGFYSGEKGNAIIYITYYSDENSASDNYEKMTRKISPENSIFERGSFFEVSGRKVYRTFGMGQTHYVFTISNRLFWISAENAWARKFLDEYIDLID